MRLWDRDQSVLRVQRSRPALFIYRILSTIRVGQVFVTLQCLVHTAGIGLCTHVTPLYVGAPHGPPLCVLLRGLFLEVRLLSFGSTHTVSHPSPDSVMSLQAASLNPVTPTAHWTHCDVFLVRGQEILRGFLEEGLWQERRGWVCGEDQPAR